MKVILTSNIKKLGKVGDLVLVKDGFARNYLFPQKKALRENNIETRDAFVPINKQKPIQTLFNIKEDSCPNANYVMENGMYLPSGNNILDDEIDYVCEKIIEANK